MNDPWENVRLGLKVSLAVIGFAIVGLTLGALCAL